MGVRGTEVHLVNNWQVEINCLCTVYGASTVVRFTRKMSKIKRSYINTSILSINPLILHSTTLFAVSRLGTAVNIRTSWRGFPSTITAAVSVPNLREPEGYKYYVFSRCKSLIGVSAVVVSLLYTDLGVDLVENH